MSKNRLQGKTLKIEKTGNKFTDEEGNEWEECVFTVELTGFSKRTPGKETPSELRGKKIKLRRYCSLNWHYCPHARLTLEPDETEAVLEGRMVGLN